MHATCTRQTHYAYTCYVRNALYYRWWLSLYVRKYSHNTPYPFSLFFIPTPTVYLAAQIRCSRCAHHLITLKYRRIIVFLQLTLGLRVRVVSGFQSCVRHQACAPGLQTGVYCTGLVDRRVSHTCARHRLCAPGLQTCACGTGLADGGVTHALLDVAFSLSHSISISVSLARFLSLSHARSFSLSLSLSLSLIHTQTC